MKFSLARNQERTSPANGFAGPLGAGLRSASLCIASGKGGTGKSVVAASLARLFSMVGRTLIVDADMGVGNAHILQDVAPEHSFVNVVEGERSVREVICECEDSLDLIPAGSGVSTMASLSPYEIQLIASGLAPLDWEYDFVIVDSAAGISDQTLTFAAACDALLLVTTPDLTALTDAYAFLKVLLRRKPSAIPTLLVNRTTEAGEGEHVAERIVSVAAKFLSQAPRSVGHLPEDASVRRSVAHRRPVVDFDPLGSASLALRGLSAGLLEELAGIPHRGFGRSLMETAS